jgi:hypothetical protein
MALDIIPAIFFIVAGVTTEIHVSDISDLSD